MNKEEFPVLRTERLVLRRILNTDAKDVLYLRSDPSINKYIKRPIERQTKNLDDALAFISMIDKAMEKDNSVLWGITQLGSDQIIGSICLWNFSEDRTIAEVGYELGTNYQGIGIMSESLQSVLSYGFNELKLSTIEAFTDKNNHSSTGMLKKNGFAWQENRNCDYNPANIILSISSNTFADKIPKR